MSNESDQKVAKLLERIDASLALVEAIKEDVLDSEPSWLAEKYGQLVVNLRTLREAVASGKMPRPSRGDTPAGAGLSLGKAAGEWCDNDEVLDSLAEIENYYRYSF